MDEQPNQGQGVDAGTPPRMTIRSDMLRAWAERVTLWVIPLDTARAFLRRQPAPDGGFQGRDGATATCTTPSFGSKHHWPWRPVDPERSRSPITWAASGTGESLDFVHLACLARCRARHVRQLAGEAMHASARTRRGHGESITAGAYSAGRRIQRGRPMRSEGSAYGSFLALGAYQDLGIDMPNGGMAAVHPVPANARWRLRERGLTWPRVPRPQPPPRFASFTTSTGRPRIAVRWLRDRAHRKAGSRSSP